MSNLSVQRAARRTFQDRLISGLNSIRFAIAEPIKLRLARKRYEHLYSGQDDPLVSVYIPTYNRGKLLVERAIPSLLAQTYKNLEIVVVGDHCTDDTEELLSKIGDPRIRFYNLPERKKSRYPDDVEIHWLAGPVIPANKALELVCGKWIARIDDDDIWTPDHVEVLIRFAQEGDYEFVSAHYIAERHGKRMQVFAPRVLDPYYTRKKPVENDTSPRIGGTQTWLYRSYLRFFRYNINCWRKAWNRVNDIELSLRIYKAGVRIGFLDRIVCYVLPRPGEVTIGIEAYKLTEKEKQAHFRFVE